MVLCNDFLQKYMRNEYSIKIKIKGGIIEDFEEGQSGGTCCSNDILKNEQKCSCSRIRRTAEDIVGLSKKKELVDNLIKMSLMFQKLYGYEISYYCGFHSSKIEIFNKSGEEHYETVRSYTDLAIVVYDSTRGLKSNSIFPTIISNDEIYNYFCEKEKAMINHALADYQMIDHGIYDVVLAPGWNGIVFHEACGHCLEGDNISNNISVFKRGDLNTSVSVPLLNFVDDPNANYGGYMEIDDEGTKTGITKLIVSGELKSFLTDKKNAAILGGISTGNGRKEDYYSAVLPRMTNTYVLPGPNSPDEIIANVKNGIYISKIEGGNVNINTGDFSFIVSEGNKIENGKLKQNIKNIMISDNNKRFLKNITGIANDLKIESGFCKKEGQIVPVGCGQPTIAIKEMFVGGYGTLL